jgi:hypothetical protein
MPDEKEKAKPAEEEPKPVVVKNPMYMTPQIAPDGHPNLSKEDIANRA